MGRKPKVFRPHLDDVECLSYGKGAKKQRGTGSRMVCHRLNQQERTLFELAKQTSILTVRGTGYRKNRKGSPLYNIFRQRCDALEQLCIIIEKYTDTDRVVIDFSTLRVKNDDTFVTQILNNVFQTKYPQQYQQITPLIPNNENQKPYTSPFFSNPIKWNEIQENPIWAVDERLITVCCDRDIAKSLAMDVLNESYNFSYDYTNQDNEDDKDKITMEENLEKGQCVDQDIKHTILSHDLTTNNDDDSIDWNDI